MTMIGRTVKLFMGLIEDNYIMPCLTLEGDVGDHFEDDDDDDDHHHDHDQDDDHDDDHDNHDEDDDHLPPSAGSTLLNQ